MNKWGVFTDQNAEKHVIPVDAKREQRIAPHELGMDCPCGPRLDLEGEPVWVHNEDFGPTLSDAGEHQ